MTACTTVRQSVFHFEATVLMFCFVPHNVALIQEQASAQEEGGINMIKLRKNCKAPSRRHQPLISAQAASWPTTSTSGCLLSAPFQADGSLESDWQAGGAVA